MYKFYFFFCCCDPKFQYTMKSILREGKLNRVCDMRKLKVLKIQLCYLQIYMKIYFNDYVTNTFFRFLLLNNCPLQVRFYEEDI